MEKSVNERQLDVLRWISDDCPAGKWPEGDYSYKTSAKALQRRGLVNITGHATSWAASITETGTYYLEHGTYPPDPRTMRSARPAKSAAHKGDGSALKYARALIKQLQAEGTVTISETLTSRLARATAAPCTRAEPTTSHQKDRSCDSPAAILETSSSSSAPPHQTRRLTGTASG